MKRMLLLAWLPIIVFAGFKAYDFARNPDLLKVIASASPVEFLTVMVVTIAIPIYVSLSSRIK